MLSKKKTTEILRKKSEITFHNISFNKIKLLDTWILVIQQ